MHADACMLLFCNYLCNSLSLSQLLSTYHRTNFLTMPTLARKDVSQIGILWKKNTKYLVGVLVTISRVVVASSSYNQSYIQ